MYVNLEIGLPTLTSNFIPDNVPVELHVGNGLIGTGPYPSRKEKASADYIKASEETVIALPGASAFRSSDSFGMIRGCHIDLAIVGGLEC